MSGSWGIALAVQRARVLFVVALVLIPGNRARAEYPIIEARIVPVARIIDNLQKAIAGEPSNVALRINLARAHAMAYATGADAFHEVAPAFRDTVERRDVPDRYVPFARSPDPAGGTPDPTALQHLNAAMRAYEDALALDPRDSVARLGYGWCLMKAGRAEAVEAFRRVIRDEWPAETALRYVSRQPITAEAIGYLLPLLDSTADAAELQDLRQKLATFEALPRMITPIVVPLEGNTDITRLVAPSTRVRFDADGSGHQHAWSWITPDAAWLVWDPEGTGKVGSALQMFGNVTFWMFWHDGYETLHALDDNQDGTLTRDELAGLALWRDANSDGVSEAGEVKPLAAWGIVSLSCRSIPEEESDYVAWSADGVKFADGTVRPTYDVLLRRQH